MKKSQMQTALFALMIVLVCGWILLEPWWQQHVSRKPVAHSPDAVSPVLQETFSRWVEQGAQLPSLADVLQDAPLADAIHINDEGNLLVDVSLRQAFDHFLTVLADQTRADVRARVAHYLHEQLPETAAVQAWDIFNRYLHYHDVVASLPMHDGSPGGQRAYMERQQQLREVLLGEDLAGAFFLPDEMALPLTPVMAPAALPARQRSQHQVLSLEARAP